MMLFVLFSCTFLVCVDVVKMNMFADLVISLLLCGVVMYIPTRPPNLLTVSRASKIGICRCRR